MASQTLIGRVGRAHIIDLLFEIAQTLQIDDKTVVYQAASLMDRYYAGLLDQNKPFADCFLTGYTAFFIAMKNSENFYYLRLSDITTKFLCNNYSRKQILQKEFDIRKAVGYENETSTLFDFVLLLVKIWKISCQNCFG